MFLDRFATPDGRARFHVVAHRGPAEQPCGEYPLILTTGRLLGQYQTGAQTRRIRELDDRGASVELHPAVAARVGVRDGDPVRVTTRRGSMQAPARVTVTIRPDTVFVPFHWVGANRLTNDALDPASRMPEFKVCAAALSPAAAAPAGDGALPTSGVAALRRPPDPATAAAPSPASGAHHAPGRAEATAAAPSPPAAAADSEGGALPTIRPRSARPPARPDHGCGAPSSVRLPDGGAPRG
jgi:formylmethanofuran dehydrogenase subunit D